MKLPLLTPRKIILGTAALFLALIFADYIFWSLAAGQYRRALDGWIEEGRAEGFQISFDEQKIFGFPSHITMRFVNPHSQSADGISFRTDSMDITASTWNWSNFSVKFKNHVQITAPLDDAGHALTLACENGEAHIKLDSQAFWRQADLSLSNSTIGLAPDYLFQAGSLSASVARPALEPKDHTEAGLTITGEADNIITPDAMPTPFGKNAKKLSAHLRVMGPIPDVRRRDSVDTWNKASGIVEFDDFSAQWGVLELASKGTLGFDDDLQPEGAFIGNIGNPAQTMRALIDHNFITMHDQGMLSSVMSLFAKPSVGKEKGMEFPITIQLGGLFLGPIRIFTFPSIEWPKEPPAVK